jgi:hypothetical protein
MKHYIPFLFAVICICYSCKKDKDDASRTELITSAAWKYDKAMVDSDSDGDGDIDVPAGTVDECEADNTLTFKTDGTGVINEGATKCDSGDPQTVNFTWTFTNNETTINIPVGVFPGFSGDVKILSLTSTKLQLQKVVTVPGIPLPVNLIVDLKH